MSTYPQIDIPKVITHKNADEVIEKTSAAIEKEEQEKKEYEKANRQKTQMQLVKEAYDKKIQWYIFKITELDKSRDGMINQIKKNNHGNIETFIQRAEKNGIDRMNHETIINMLQKQYQEWFGQLPEHLSIPEYKICFDELEVL